MLRLGVRVLHALRQFCAQIAGQRAVFAALRPSQGEVDPGVVLAACKTLASGPGGAGVVRGTLRRN